MVCPITQGDHRERCWIAILSSRDCSGQSIERWYIHNVRYSGITACPCLSCSDWSSLSEQFSGRRWQNRWVVMLRRYIAHRRLDKSISATERGRSSDGWSLTHANMSHCMRSTRLFTCWLHNSAITSTNHLYMDAQDRLSHLSVARLEYRLGAYI